jgi:hypothetical protein
MTPASETSAVPRGAKPTEWARTLYERQIAISGELAEDGLEITKHLKAEILAAPANEATQAMVMAYGRAARSVRLSLMLQARLVGEAEARDGGQNSASVPPAPLYRIERIIIDPARREVEDAENTEGIERLTGEASERLDREDFRRFGEAAGLALLDQPVDGGTAPKSSPHGSRRCAARPRAGWEGDRGTRWRGPFRERPSAAQTPHPPTAARSVPLPQ